MNRRTLGFLLVTTILALIALALFGLAGCEIQKMEPPHTGSVFVTLSSGGSTVTGALVRVDGAATTRLTPALITNLSVGSHRISAFKPGYIDTAAAVDVTFNGLDTVALFTDPATDGAINLAGAPDGTVLFVHNLPVDTVPVTPEYPTVFGNIGLGTFEVTAYCPGHATEAPSKWNVTLMPYDTVTVSPVFTVATEGWEVGNLAPGFNLPGDWGTNYGLQNYRGKVCLVSFFFYDCSACQAEFPYIASMYSDSRYANKIQFLGVDFADPYSRFAQFRQDHPALGITFPLLHDRMQTVKTAYNIFNCPANFIVDASGRIRLATGSISESLLHQTVDELLNASSARSFSLSMRDTLVNYTARSQTYEFHGSVVNRLTADRSLTFNARPASFPDTCRQIGICVGPNCLAPSSGARQWATQLSASETDTLRFDLYPYVADWSQGFQMSQDSAIYGDYLMDFVVFATDNPSERDSFRLHLHDSNTTFALPQGPLAARSAKRLENH